MNRNLWGEKTLSAKRKLLLAQIRSAEQAAQFFMEKIKKFSKSPTEALALDLLYLYAPLADRFGMGKLKTEMEDLAMSLLQPQKYHELKNKLDELLPFRNEALERVQGQLEKVFEEEKIIAEIKGRTKGIYSTYKKLLRVGDLSSIHDLLALRVIVLSVEDCYAVLGLIHQLFEPESGHFEDYLAKPKLNGYRSLHTTVRTENGKLMEFQIRTEEMDQQAKWGRAAHWYYSLFKEEKERKEKRGIIAPKPKEAQDTIFVQTPKGDLVELGPKSTPLDYAYGIHSDLGNNTFGAKVNGKIVSLDYELSGGEVVYIMTSKHAHPHPDWLSKVKTEKAKAAIRHFLSLTNQQKSI